MAEEPDAYETVKRVAELLGATEPQLKDYGATKSASLRIDERAVEVLQQRDITIEVGLSLPGLPTSVGLYFAPEGSYERAKLLETVELQARPISGHEDFDRLYVVLGDEAAVVISRLADALPDLVETAELRPDLNQIKLNPGEPPKLWPHLRTRVALVGDVDLLVAAVRRTIDLAAAVEKAWASG